MWRASAWLTAGSLLVGALTAPGAGASSGRSIDYLYVESNEGGSSGGHVALRFGDRVFHFQYSGSGFLRVSRANFEGFRRHYTLLENRTIYLTRIPVTAETFDLVHDFFNRRRIIQHQHFAVLQSLEGDRALMQSLLDTSRGERASPVVLEGAGFFFDDEGPPAPDAGPPGAGRPSGGSEPSPILLALRERIAAAHGSDFLGRRLEDIRQQLETLDPAGIEAPSLDVDADRAPAPVYGFAQRYKDALVARRALEVLETGRSLRPGSYVHTGHPDAALGEDEARDVDDLAEALSSSLVRLVRSERPDWGAALMVGLARLAALEKTRQLGAWVFLDAFAADAPRLTRARLARQPELLQALLREARRDFDGARAELHRGRQTGSGFREIAFAELEASGNGLIEALRAAHERRDLRLPQGRQSPARGAVVRELVVPRPLRDGLPGQLVAATAREGEYTALLKRLYGYQLLTRNCVTEIFREIDRAFVQGREADPVGGAALAREESRRRLGGHLEMTGLRFIPAVSDDAVAETYAVSERIALPSHRQARLARLYREEPPLRVFWRESNTLTSTLYRRNPEDSYFLFFTDDATVARPLFGALNLATGLGATVAGVATLPFDRGQTLWAGLKGVVFSLPELFFFNIRKGSFDYVEADRRIE